METTLSVAEAKALLDCDESQVRRLFAQGKLTGRRIGKRVLLIDTASVIAYRDTPRAGPGYPRGRPRKGGAEHAG